MKSFMLIVLACSFRLAAAELPALIPQPQSVVPGAGALSLPQEVSVAAGEAADLARPAAVLREAGLKVVPGAAGATLSVRRAEVRNPLNFAGAYRLEVGAAAITLTAKDAAGIVHGAETLRQLLRVESGKVSVPRVVIEDWPAFPVRGFMLDTGRNYQTPALLREQLEVMCRYKLNVFHFHFTDNPGWRLESRVHPQVTSVMTRQQGKFYTQREFRELVAFCRERAITLVPEMDMPGHSESFRKALGISAMNAPESRRILKDLLTELAGLAPPEVMPYIHLGTDEVRGRAEKVDATFLPEMAAHVRSLGREVIGWHKGIDDKADTRRITQLWARANPLPRNPFIDSRSTYLNHMDPLEALTALMFRQPCGVPHGDERALGGVLCSWPDIRIERERDQLRQNPIYPGMMVYAESIWRGVPADRPDLWANLPRPGTPEFRQAAAFEARMLDHRARFFANKEFPYVKHTDLRWRVIGPFPHGGDVTREFPVERELKPVYQVDGRDFRWLDGEFAGGTVYLKHFFGFQSPIREAEGTCYALTRIWSPDARTLPVWIGFHGSSRSDRRGAGLFRQGEWHAKQPWVRVNGRLVDPPVWENAGVEKGSEVPFTNEDYFFRKPATIQLKRGWNEVLLKIPHRKGDWKWMFTFAPAGGGDGLRHSADLEPRDPS